MKWLFKDPKFIKTAIKPKDYPVLKNERGQILPEVAVAGRSNVGKSTLLNHLFAVKGLVKTSSTPGKTQAINFFTLNDALGFVDLPGYGFANVPPEVRKEWGPMVQNYLEQRQTLQLILLVFDIRRLPNEDDMQFIQWVVHSGHSLILILNKVDKVKTNELKTQTKKILDAFNIENLQYVHYSAPDNVGRPKLCSMICEALTEVAQEKKEG